MPSAPAPWIFMIRQRLVLGGGVETGHVDIHYVVIWTANQSGPVTLTFDSLNFDPESGVRVTCDVGYLCANFSLPRPLCSRLISDVRDRRQIDVRRETKASLNAPRLVGAGHNKTATALIAGRAVAVEGQSNGRRMEGKSLSWHRTRQEESAVDYPCQTPTLRDRLP